MRHRFSNALLSSTVFGLVLGLGMQAHAATLGPGDTLVILSDTPEFLNLQFNLSYVVAPVSTAPLDQNGFIAPGPVVPFFLGENWNVFVGNDVVGPNNKGRGIRLFAEQVIQSPNLVRPQARFAGGDSYFQLYPFPAKQVSYLTDAPVGSYSTVTCSFGSTNCVSYEFGALSST
jgi:hypothetical protein